MRVRVICGGPSAERGISLNSARSVTDHLYSNTPSDFDFKRVLLGGITAERQVSLMSGTNVWLKFLHAPSI
jgi:D-alanine-D-alanine ligase-like ATP-grasp enzyme